MNMLPPDVTTFRRFKISRTVKCALDFQRDPQTFLPPLAAGLDATSCAEELVAGRPRDRRRTWGSAMSLTGE
jgi:hypothetical protein